jgi:hypothetical protein
MLGWKDVGRIHGGDGTRERGGEGSGQGRTEADERMKMTIVLLLKMVAAEVRLRRD